MSRLAEFRQLEQQLAAQFVIPTQLYEEIEAGKHYDFYCVYKKSKISSKITARYMRLRRRAGGFAA